MASDPETLDSIAQAAEDNSANWQQLEDRLLRVTQELGTRAWPRIARGLNALPPGRAAHLLEAGTPHQRAILWSLLDDDQEAEVTPLLSSEVRQDLLSKMSSQELHELAMRLDTDEMVDIFSDLPERITRDLINSMDAERARRVESVMAWPPGTAGNMMAPEVPALMGNNSIYLALQYIGEQDEEVRGLERLPVTNRKGLYRGCVSFAELIAGQRTAPVSTIVSQEPRAIRASAPTEEVIDRMDGTEWDCLPVVDDDNRLLGVIRRDRIIDSALKQADAMARRQTGADEDTFTPLLQSTRRRGIWLAANLGTAVLAAGVIGLFQESLAKAVALAVLMPIVTSMGGVAATQSLAITVRALALNQLHSTNVNWLLNREISVGFLCGLLLAVPSVLMVLAWFTQWLLAALLAVAILLNLVIGALAGVLIPVLMRRLNLDAGISGAVIVTTVTDVAGFAIFLGLGALFYV